MAFKTKYPIKIDWSKLLIELIFVLVLRIDDALKHTRDNALYYVYYIFYDSFSKKYAIRCKQNATNVYGKNATRNLIYILQFWSLSGTLKPLTK